MSGTVQEMFTLHDQGDDAIHSRYSVFRGDEIVLLFNSVPGGITPQNLVTILNAADLLDPEAEARERELVAELSRMVEHFGIFATDHSMDASTETWAALHCARALLQRREAK